MNTKFKYAKEQGGMTFIGIMLMFLFVGFLLLAVLRIWPLYYENFAVQKTLVSFADDYKDNKSITLQKLKTSLQTRLDVQDVRNLKVDNIEFKKSRKGYTVDASYKAVANYIGNLNFMVEFNHVLELEN